MLFAEVLHQARAEIAAQGRRHDLHAQKIGMRAREQQAADAQRRLHGPRVLDERRMRGLGRGEGGRRFGRAAGDPSGKLRHGLQLVVADAPAAHDEAVFGGVEPAVEPRHVVAREAVVGLLVRRDAVRMPLPEQRPCEGLAGLHVDLRPLDRQPLSAFGSVGAQLLLGECGAEQDLLRHGEGRVEEFREGGEIDVGVVAVDVHVVPRAVVVELFGDLVRCHVARAFGEEVGGGRRREGRLLKGRSGAEDERDAQHLEIVGGERVESDAVGQRRAAVFGDLDLRGRYAGLCHFLAL